MDLRYFLFAKALADYRAGRFDEATAILKGATSKVLVPGPQVLLAMTQHRLGHREDALATLAATTPAFDWRPTQGATARPGSTRPSAARPRP